MELIVRVDASTRTKEMLLDTFMNGFIFQLFTKKWHLYGRKLHYLQLSLVLALLISEVVQTFALKWDPMLLSTRGIRSQSVLHLALICILLADSLYTTFLSDRNDRGASDARFSRKLSLGYRLRNAYQFSVLHGVPWIIFAHACATVGSLMILINLFPPVADLGSTDQWYRRDVYAPLPPPSSPGGDRTSAVTHRALKGGGGGDPSPSESVFLSWELYNEEMWGVLWALQSVALLLMSVHAMSLSFMPAKRLSVLFNTIQRMFFGDIVLFFGVWLGFVTAFYFALFVLYPRSGAAILPHVQTFNSWYTALFALIDLSFIGEKVEFDLLWEEGALDGHLSNSQYFDLFLWIGLYYLFMVVSLVLLINLLIAMMSETYGRVFANATLQSRLSLAAHLFRLELLADSFKMATLVGDEAPPGSGRFVYVFKAVDNDTRDDSGSDDGYEGDFDNGSDPFLPPEPSMQSRILTAIDDLKMELSSQQVASAEASAAHSEEPWYGSTRKRRAAIHPCNKMLRKRGSTSEGAANGASPVWRCAGVAMSAASYLASTTSPQGQKQRKIKLPRLPGVSVVPTGPDKYTPSQSENARQDEDAPNQRMEQLSNHHS